MVADMGIPQPSHIGRLYIIFKRARCCIRIFTDLDREAFQARLGEALRDRKSLFLTVYERNGEGFRRCHTTVTPYEILVDCVFHFEEVLPDDTDLCRDLKREARSLQRLLREHRVTQVKK